MRQQPEEYMLLDGVSPQSVTSSTDTTPIVVTKASHGYATGDLVMIYGHATNVAANGIFKIVKVDANSFQLTNRYTGASIVGSGAGAGSGGVMVLCPKIPVSADFDNAELQFSTSGSANMTVKVAISNGIPDSQETTHGDCPNFGATVSANNPYSFAQIVNLDSNVATDGSTGIVLTGTDVQRNYEVNMNRAKFITIIPTAWSAGAISAKLILSKIG